MQSLRATSRLMHRAAGASRSFHSAATIMKGHHHANSATPATPATHVTPKTTANTAADIRRIFREQQRQAAVNAELFPWEVTQTKVTAWEPKYEDERKFYFASKIQEGQENLNGKLLKRYAGGYGTKYLLSKRNLASPANLSTIDMTNPKELKIELQMAANVLSYWFLNLQTGQHPQTTVPAQLPSRGGAKGAKTLKLNLSRENVWNYLTQLHELWPRKDERDIAWMKLPRREHGQYRIKLQRVLAEGPSKPLNAATQSFIDFLTYQLIFHFREAKQQNRNMHWLQFLGVPGVKITKKWGGEIKVPKLKSQE